MKRRPFLIGWLLLAIPAAVQAQFLFTTNNGTITITGYTGTNSVVAIPSTIDGLPVSSIGFRAFYASIITSVTMPNSVTNVGAYAFEACHSLTSVTLGSGVTSIEAAAFGECTSLTSVTLGSGVSSIGDYAFSNCKSVTNVTIPNTVTSIGEFAFINCTSLTSVTLGSGVTTIGLNAFVDCSSLTNIIVDPLNSAYSSMGGVLFNQSQTILVEYPDGKLGGYTIPNSVTNVADSAFEDCTSLTSVTLGSGVTTVGFNAFLDCSSLIGITLGSGVTTIGDYAFAGCTNLAAVTIPNSVTTIGDLAFGHCYSLTSLYFQGNAPSVGGTNVFIDDRVTIIYYLPGTAGWGSTFVGRPTALWTLPYPLILTSSPNFGVRTNQFGFTVSWATNLDVVVEAATDLAHPIWSPMQTNTLTSGWFYFSDPQWKNYPARFYRIWWP